MINWGNNSALAGFQNALAMGADIGGAIKQNREDNALGAFLEASRGPSSAPTGGALTAQVQRPPSDVGGVGDAMGGMIPAQWGGNGGGIVATPEDQSASEAAYARLSKINPRLAMQAGSYIEDRQAKRAKYAQEQRANQLRQQAAKGDPDALQQLVGIDFDSWKALDANKRRMVEDQTKYTGQAALRISQLPADQQAAAWDQAIDQGVSAGYSGMADYRGKFSAQALQGAIDNAGLVENFIKLAEPKYMAVPEGGTLVDTRNPAAVGSFAAGQSPQVTAPASKADYEALPPGAEYRAPDGSIKRKGGGVRNGTGGF